MTRQELEARLEELAPYEKEFSELVEQLIVLEMEPLVDYACMEGFITAREDSNGHLRLYPLEDATCFNLDSLTKPSN